MNLSMRTFAVSILSSGLIALASSVAMAQSVNNVDNTSPGESGHGTNCSNHVGGCYTTQESSVSGAFGTYQPTTNAAPASSTMGTTTAPAVNPDNTTPGESGHGTGDSAPLNRCLPASEATPGHCISGGTNS
jgi:hypothetical protein